MQRPPLTIQHDEWEVFPEHSWLDCRNQLAQTWAYVTSGISGLTNLLIFDSPTSAAGDAEWNCCPKHFLVCDVCSAVSLLNLSKLYSKQTLNFPQNFNFETPYCHECFEESQVCVAAERQVSVSEHLDRTNNETSVYD